MSFNFTDGTFLESNESSNDWALKMDMQAKKAKVKRKYFFIRII
jgi:hypothetical protein